jgi:glycosyltransferase involved in cell wall biosynthesis
MNILFICDEYPPGKNGGIGTMVQVLGRELVKQGNRVFVVGLYNYRYGSADHETDHGVEVWRFRYGYNLPFGDNNKLYGLYERLPGFVKQRLNGTKAFNKFITFINELIRQKSIDIIEIQDWNSFAFSIGFDVRWPKFEAPLVVKSNGSYTYFADEAGDEINKTLFETDLALYKRADALSAVSHYTAQKNIRLFNITAPVKVLYNSIEIPEVSRSAGRHKCKVIFTGTLIPKKGIFQLMQAWNIVSQKYPEATLDVYGKGKIKPLRQLLSKEAAATVNFKGHVSRQELFNELSQATMAVFPSYSECFALAPLEAMAVGCPVVNTSRSSGRELVKDGENGSLIDPDNISEMAEKITQLISDPKLQQKYSDNGKRTVLTQFNITKSAQDHVTFYNSVLDTSSDSNSDTLI